MSSLRDRGSVTDGAGHGSAHRADSVDIFVEWQSPDRRRRRSSINAHGSGTVLNDTVEAGVADALFAARKAPSTGGLQVSPWVRSVVRERG